MSQILDLLFEELNRENHEAFIQRFIFRVTPSELVKINFAYEMAKAGHYKQFRDDGRRYFEHLRETAIILTDELEITDFEMIIAALLHDMLEDSYLLNPTTIKSTFGDRVAMLVTTVTKPKKNDTRFSSNEERHRWYFEEVAKSCIEAKIIKLADRLQNMRTLDACIIEKRIRKIKETERVYFPLINDVGKVHPYIGIYLEAEMRKAISHTIKSLG